MFRWAKVACDLHSNRKIRKSGRLGREVFLFVLARNAAGGSLGRISAADLDPEYLADQLQMPAEEASIGVKRAIDAELIRIDGGFALICGWNGEWAKIPKSGKERTAKWRSSRDVGSVTIRHSDEEKRHGDPGVVNERYDETPRNVSSSQDVTVTKERRGEEKRSKITERKKRRVNPDTNDWYQPAVDAFDSYYREENPGSKPTWDGTTINTMKTLCRKHGHEEIVRRIKFLQNTPPEFPRGPWTVRMLSGNIDRLVPTKNGNSKPRATGRVEPLPPEAYPGGEQKF